MNPTKFKQRYGPWALITGASQGIGQAFAEQCAKNGLNVYLTSRRKVILDGLADRFRADYKVEAVTHGLDLTDPDALIELERNTSEYDIGLFLYAPAVSPIGSFFAQTIEEHDQVINLNCRAPVHLAYHFGNLMKKRKRGGILLMGSLAGFQGSPIVAHYSATKAYNLTLAEAIWEELKSYGVDVKCCVAGATSTPAFIERTPLDDVKGIKPKIMTPEAVAKECLRKMHRNKPFIVAGTFNKVTSWILRRITSRKFAIKTIGSVNRKMYGDI
jgi:short-subunit dehydrogenase